MKIYVLSCLFSICLTPIFGQKLDLIVTANHDSLACSIDSISSETIFFKAKLDGKKIQSTIPMGSVSSYEFAYIEKEKILRVPGTIYFHSNPLEVLNLKQNTIYGTVGTFIIVGILGGSYERLLLSRSQPGFTSLWLRLGAGYFASWGFNGPFGATTIHALTGRKKNHFEVSFGLAGIQDTYDKSLHLTPAGGIGYRYQNPEGGFLFRTGISWPETVYIGVGFNF